MVERGVTPVVGITLLIGMVLVGAIGVFAVGSVAVDSVQSEAKLDQAETAMVSYADSVRNGQSASLSVPNSGETTVSNDSTIRIEVGSTEVVDTTLGTVVYEENGRERAFEGGAVFARSSDEPTIVAAPPISFQYAAGERHQTLTIDVVTVDGSASDLTTEPALSRSSARSIASNGVVADTVTVTVQSEYAAAWAQYFEQRTLASVSLDASTNTVTARFPVQQPTSVDNSFTVDGSLSLGGNIGVDSYDSTTSQGTGSVGIGNYRETNNGDVVATEGFSGHGSMHVDGDLYVNDSFRFDGGTSVDGDVFVRGDLEIDNGNVNDTLVSGGDVRVTGGGVTFTEHSEVRAAGDFVDSNSNTYEGLVHAGGLIDATGGWSTVRNSASFVAGGSIAVHPSPDPSQLQPNAAAPSTAELQRIDDAVSSIPDPAERVDTAFDHYGGTPTDPGIGGKNAHDTLTAGTYRLNRSLDYGGNPSLTFDTTGGDVVLLVDGDVNAKNIDAEVIGDGQVHIYITGNFESTGNPEWTNPDGAGNRLFVYTADATAETHLASDFYGVVFSESRMKLGGSTTIYGGVVMDGTSMSGGQNVYFDEALSGADIAITQPNGSNARQTYVHVSQTTVSTDD